MHKNSVKRIIILIVITVLLFGLSACKQSKNPEVTMLIDGYGEIVIELFPKKAPNTVKNFINLV